ncbi:unnamed protein product [Arctogadus glacialis]
MHLLSGLTPPDSSSCSSTALCSTARVPGPCPTTTHPEPGSPAAYQGRWFYSPTGAPLTDRSGLARAQGISGSHTLARLIGQRAGRCPHIWAVKGRC